MNATQNFNHLPLVSIIIPVFNEENNIHRAYNALKEVFKKLEQRYRFEIIFTDNHSIDKTFDILESISKIDDCVRVVRFSRNFGFNKSVLTGYRLAGGQAAIQLDCDLQDPPHLIPEFLLLWEDGHDVVVGIRKKREEGWFLQYARKTFYRFLNKISEDNLIIDGGDFRLTDLSILDQIRNINDTTPYVRGLISSLARNQTGIPYERRARLQDKSKFPFLKLVSLAIEGIVNHSTLPLRLASISGVMISIATLFLACIYLFGRLFFGLSCTLGFTTNVVLILFGISLNGLFLGVIGEYIGRIYLQIRQRPLTIIEKIINIDLKNQNNSQLKKEFSS